MPSCSSLTSSSAAGVDSAGLVSFASGLASDLESSSELLDPEPDPELEPDEEEAALAFFALAGASDSEESSLPSSLDDDEDCAFLAGAAFFGGAASEELSLSLSDEEEDPAFLAGAFFFGASSSDELLLSLSEDDDSTFFLAAFLAGATTLTLSSEEESSEESESDDDDSSTFDFFFGTTCFSAFLAALFLLLDFEAALTLEAALDLFFGTGSTDEDDELELGLGALFFFLSFLLGAATTACFLLSAFLLLFLESSTLAFLLGASDELALTTFFDSFFDFLSDLPIVLSVFLN